MGVLGAILPILLVAAPVDLTVHHCVDVDGMGACAYSEPRGTGKSTGVDVAGPQGVWARAHDDEFDGFAGHSRVIMIEAGQGDTNVYWGAGWTDTDFDGVPEDVCVVCGAVWDPYTGPYVYQGIWYDPSGVHSVLLFPYEGTMRGVSAGVADGQPYANVFLP